MTRRTLLGALCAVLVAGSAVALTAVAGSSFLGAPAGVSARSVSLDLPPVVGSPLTPAVDGPFGPTFEELVTGETILTTHEQWTAVCKRLFGPNPNRPKVDFTKDFVVLTGGGLMSLGDYSISSVERVDATWASFPFGGATDRFLAVTSTTFLPGVPPPVPPPPTWRVAGVRIPRVLLDDVVFHREVIAAP